MNVNTLITVTVIAFASSASMAATVGDLQKAGGNKLNKEEATAVLVAQGCKMTRQGAKIDLTALADGTLSGKMKASQGDFEPKGTYTVAEDGEVCIKTSFSAKHIHPQAPDQSLSFCVNAFSEKAGTLRFARNAGESTDLIDLLQ
jgi:hypothetical protein